MYNVGSISPKPRLCLEKKKINNKVGEFFGETVLIFKAVAYSLSPSLLEVFVCVCVCFFVFGVLGGGGGG